MVTRRGPPAKLVSKAAVGARLRELRKRKGLTLKQLSQSSGVPLSTLSKIELGQTSLSYDKLMAIALSLDVEMSAFMQTGDHPTDTAALAGLAIKVSSVNHDEYATENYQHKFLFGDVGGKVMTPILATVFSRDSDEFIDFIRHRGQEFAFVLSGSVRIVFENGKTIELKKDEAAYFDSSVGHMYLSMSKTPAKVLAVCSDRP